MDVGIGKEAANAMGLKSGNVVESGRNVESGKGVENGRGVERGQETDCGKKSWRWTNVGGGREVGAAGRLPVEKAFLGWGE
eukprot:11168448-Lingulodinium_polyedra.AAC.1